MKQVILSAILIFTFAGHSIEAARNSRLQAVLEAIQDSIRATRSLSYQATYTNVNPNLEDSIYTTRARVWLIRVPNDSIFGCHFHVSGKDHYSAYEYYYDGQYSYEIRHDTITVFNPRQYPNTPSNPAKARTALLPFVHLIIDPNIVHTLLNGVVNESLIMKKSKRVLTLSYGKDK